MTDTTPRPADIERRTVAEHIIQGIEELGPMDVDEVEEHYGNHGRDIASMLCDAGHLEFDSEKRCFRLADDSDDGFDLAAYQSWTEETAIYPDEFPAFVDAGLVYTTMGLNDEAGEVLGKLKKAIREDDETYLSGMRDELSDVCWYLARVHDELDWDLEETFEVNQRKLMDRADRDVLEGEGDDR